jgi:hypothetical protein
MFSSHLGMHIFISIQINVGQIYVHFLGRTIEKKGCLKRGVERVKNQDSIEVRFCNKSAEK